MKDFIKEDLISQKHSLVGVVFIFEVVNKISVIKNNSFWKTIPSGPAVVAPKLEIMQAYEETSIRNKSYLEI